jgi:hypothetical protein
MISREKLFRLVDSLDLKPHGLLLLAPRVGKSKIIIDIIKKNNHNPNYTIFTNTDVGELLRKKIKNINIIDLYTSKQLICKILNNTNTLIVYVPTLDSSHRYIIKDIFFQLLPSQSSLIIVGDGKSINNKHLLQAINTNIITNVTADSLDANYRTELLNTKKVIYTKNNAWKYNINMNTYINTIITHITAVQNDCPYNILLDRN